MKPKDIYGDLGRKYDYIHRVLASFAEIYHFEYTKSSILEEGTIKTNGMTSKIRSYYKNHRNEEETAVKIFYSEPIIKEEEQTEYGFLTFKEQSDSSLAEIISLAVRLLEAFGIKDVTVELNCPEPRRKYLLNYFDVLDINYEEKKLKTEYFSDCVFEITQKKGQKTISMIQGGDLTNLGKKVGKLDNNIFGFRGNIEAILEMTDIPLEEELLDIVITFDSEIEKEKAYYLTQELRLNGFKTECIKRIEKSYIKKHFNTKYVISMKEEEMKKDEVVLTDLYTGEKQTIKELDLIQYLDIQF